MKKVPVRDFVRIFLCSDLHCGSFVGLTPPHHWITEDKKDPRRTKWARTQRAVWKYFEQTIEESAPYDFCICNGDALEGLGTKSGGTELWTSDRKVQTDCAAFCIDAVGAKVVRLTYGTSYHVASTGEDWEDVLAATLGCKIGSHEWYDINGRIFDCKHHVAGSSIPHGALTPLAREILWNRVWASRGEQPKADVLVRSHTHTYEMVDHDGCLGFVTPALQGFGSKFGSRRMSKTVDIGVLIIDVYNTGEIVWHPHKLRGVTQIAKAERL